MDPSPETSQKIESLVKSERVVLFMKGTRSAPQCGFSATVVGILDQYLPHYATVNVLADPEVRDGVKAYANWPTIPQLFIDGEFVGGCDIVREMDAQGELLRMLGDAVQLPDPPSITISDAAARVFAQAMEDATEDDALRLHIDAMFHHTLALEPRRKLDIEVTANGVTLILDPATARRARGLVVDYVEAPQAGFKMDNPNAPPAVQQISASEAHAFVQAHPEAKFIDVRTPQERAQSSIGGTVLLSRDNIEALEALPKDTPLVFHCHHGQRSHQAAVHFLEQGFTRVYNVVGGIEAWSTEVDPSVPRY